MALEKFLRGIGALSSLSNLTPSTVSHIMPPSTTLSPTISDLVHVITTTIYSSTPSSGASSPLTSSLPSNTVPFPLASVIGGSLAGAMLAIAVVVAWKLWGRSIERKNERKRQEAMAIHTTLENTRKNASIYSPGKYTPVFTYVPERKVRFAFSSTPSEKRVDMETSPNNLRSRPPSPAVVDSEIVRKPSDDAIAVVEMEYTAHPLPLVHKASNASSLSMYSTQSGEAHLLRPPPSAIPRKWDPRRLSNFTRSSRTMSLYSALGDIDEMSQGSHETRGSK